MFYLHIRRLLVCQRFIHHFSYPSNSHIYLHLTVVYSFARSHITTHDDSDFEGHVNNFFTQLFPVAYHRALHSGSDAVAAGDFHHDYKNCLQHTYEDLQPFGSIPKTLGRNLQQSLGAANVFMTSLERAADILASTEQIDSDYLEPKCRQHLMKMTYCAQCNGLSKHRTKSCFGYCTNVMR